MPFVCEIVGRMTKITHKRLLFFWRLKYFIRFWPWHTKWLWRAGAGAHACPRGFFVLGAPVAFSKYFSSSCLHSLMKTRGQLYTPVFSNINQEGPPRDANRVLLRSNRDSFVFRRPTETTYANVSSKEFLRNYFTSFIHKRLTIQDDSRG